MFGSEVFDNYLVFIMFNFVVFRRIVDMNVGYIVGGVFIGGCNIVCGLNVDGVICIFGF